LFSVHTSTLYILQPGTICYIATFKSVRYLWTKVLSAVNLQIFLHFLVISITTKLSHKLKFSNPHIFVNGWSKPLIFQTLIFWSNSNSIEGLQTLGWKNIRNKKSAFLAKIQFLSQIFQFSMKDFHNENKKF